MQHLGTFSLSVAELAAQVGGELIGDGSAAISGFAGAGEVGAGQLTFAVGETWRQAVMEREAGAVLLDAPLEGASFPQIIVKDPNLAFAQIIEMAVRSAEMQRSGVHPSAVIDAEAEVHSTAWVGENAVIATGAKVGANTQIGAGVYVGPNCRIGCDSSLRPNVTVMDGSVIGDRVVIHPSSVIGSDGFGFATTEAGQHVKVPQIGSVVIEDDVEIGSCVCIDRARMAETRIGRGTKIDNLVQIGHNVTLGPNCLLVAQAGIAGSSELGRNVTIGGASGVTGHVKLGDYAQVSAFSGVAKNLAGAQGYMGVPAIPIRDGMRVRLFQQKLPAIAARLKEVEARLAELEGRKSD